MYRKNVAGQFVSFQGVDATTGGIKSGVTWTMRRCLDGTFAAGGGTVTEDGSTGWYKCALAQADTNGNDCQYNFTGTGAVPQTINIVTTAADPTDSVRLGLTALPNAAAEAAGGLYTRGTGAGQIKQTNNGEIDSNTTHINNVVTSPVTTIKAVLGLAVDGVVTTVTNQLTAAQIATGIWQDTTAGDFTTALSIGKSIMNGVSLGTGLKIAECVLADTLTTYTGNTPQTGDSYARIGANGVGLSAIPDEAGVTTLLGRLTATRAGYLDNLSAGAVALASGVTVTTNNDKTGYSIGSGGIGSAALTAAAVNLIADGFLDRNMATGTDSGTDSTVTRTPRQALRVLRNKVSITAGTATVTKEDDSTASWTAAVATTAGNPISAVDPT